MEGTDTGLVVLEPLLGLMAKDEVGGSNRVVDAAFADGHSFSPAAPGSATDGWRLWLLASRSVEQAMALHLEAQDWDAALQLATAYGLDHDDICRARWSSQAVSVSSLHQNLALLANTHWAAEEVVRALLAWGLELSQRELQRLAALEGSSYAAQLEGETH
ncbi:hypothetical protein QJQ45_007459, partial [Haematococcus lacustris]